MQPTEPAPAQALPYATPFHLAANAAPTGAWRDGMQLVTTSRISLPDTCVKCNAPANGFRLRKVYYWHTPALYFTILAGVLVYAIVALILRKKAEVELGLCPAHRSARRRWMAITWVLCLILPLACWIGAGVLMSQRSTEDVGVLLIPVGILVLLVGAIVGVMMTRVLKPTKIDEAYAWFSGVAPAYLQQFPPAR